MGHSSSFPVAEVALKKSNGFHSFIMFSDSAYKYKRGVTSFVLEFFNKVFNLSKSHVDIFDIISGVDDFSFDEFSVFDGVIINTFVGIHNSSEFGNSFSKIGFSCVMCNFECSSFIKGRLFETVKDIHNSIDSITSLFFQLQELHHLGVNKVSRGNSQKEDKNGGIFHFLCY